MNERYYIKQGRRYVPVAYWHGFPANGVWYVEDGRSSLIMKVGDLPDPMPLAAMERHADAAVAAIAEAREAGPTSAQELWRAAIKAIAKEMGDD